MLSRPLILSLVLTGCTGPAATVRTGSDDACATIFAAGDILLDRGVRERAYVEGDPAWPLGTLPGLIDGADLALANLECPLTSRNAPAPRQFVFRCDPAMAKRLRTAGLTVLSLANNHSYDHGRASILDTMSALDEASIVSVGAGKTLDEASRPRFFEVNGVAIAVLGYVTLPLDGIIWDPDQPTPAMADDDLVAKHLKDARERADVVIVTVHWGREFRHAPSPRQLRWATYFREHGADVVLGHHPHSVQPVEAVNNRWTFYSLGNFVFDQKKPPGNLAIAVRLTVCQDGVRDVSVLPLEIIDTRPTPARPEPRQSILHALMESSPDLRFSTPADTGPILVRPSDPRTGR